MKTSPSYHQTTNSKGFSLIELLVVITILLVIASAGFFTLSENQDQQRYEETVRRHETLRDAIIGKKEIITLNGSPISNGYISDLGLIPTDSSSNQNNFIKRLLSNVDPADPDKTNYKPYDVFGSNLLAADVIDPGSLQYFRDHVYGNIKFYDGWRGPYIQSAEQDVAVVEDGWGEALILSPQDPDDLDKQEFFNLFSRGKGGEDDSITPPSDELGYEEDYPETKSILAHEYEVSPVPLPDGIIIEIKKSLVEHEPQRRNLYVGLIYPGLELEDPMSGSFNPYEIQDDGTLKIPLLSEQVSGPVHRALDLGRTENSVFEDPDFIPLSTTLEDLEDPTEIDKDGVAYMQFPLIRKEGPALFFNKLLARRYQIALFEKGRIQPNKEVTAKISDRLGDAIISVYPQVFQFIQGNNPPPSISASPIWVIRDPN